MKRMRLVAYLLYVYAVPDGYRHRDDGFRVPRAVLPRLVRWGGNEPA